VKSAVAFGYRAHSGWAVAIAVGGSRRAPDILARRRIELISATPSQPYHAAEGLSLKAAERLIQRSEAIAERLAAKAIAKMIEEQRSASHVVARCALLLSSSRPMPPLETTLASHALIHAAEGELFRAALARASEHAGLAVVGFRERDLIDEAQRRLRLGADEIAARLTEFGREFGPPWTQDEKRATLAAWLTLRA